MLEILTKLICFVSIAVIGFYIIKVLTKSDTKLFTIKNMCILSILVLVPFLMYKIEYTGTYTLIIYLISIIVYKKIFGFNLPKTVISTSIMMIITFIGDLLTMIIVMNFADVESIRKIWYIRLTANCIMCFISFVICNLIKNNKTIININKKFDNTNDKISLIFMILLILVFTIIAYNFYSEFKWNSEYLMNIIIASIFLILMYIYLQEKNNFMKLSDNYDNLFNYVQNFEDWIEKEQLNRHEYKNQLAVLRGITKEKATKNKIDEILEENINLEGEVINQLKALPKGGIKGLMYYKIVVAQKNNIDLTIDVSIKKKTILNKLSKKEVKDICKLIGIYFDNAIEAAIKTKKKRILVEIYELKNKVNVVISNTFNKTKNFENRNKKGITSKGKGRGNGLYFASRILKNNKRIIEKQKIIDKYYIQEISILKLEK